MGIVRLQGGLGMPSTSIACAEYRRGLEDQIRAVSGKVVQQKHYLVGALSVLALAFILGGVCMGLRFQKQQKGIKLVDKI